LIFQHTTFVEALEINWKSIDGLSSNLFKNCLSTALLFNFFRFSLLFVVYLRFLVGVYLVVGKIDFQSKIHERRDDGVRENGNL
jgi:hypothetical protein